MQGSLAVSKGEASNLCYNRMIFPAMRIDREQFHDGMEIGDSLLPCDGDPL